MKRYRIKKGKHSSRTFPRLVINPSYLAFCVTFGESANYDLNDEVDQQDINKLYGVSFGHHHQNSIRIGWRWYQNKLQLFTYMYVDGERIDPWEADTHLADIEIGKLYTIQIDLSKPGKYTVMLSGRLNPVLKEYKRPEKLFPIGYKLYPYFGGNRTAPHDITIMLEEFVCH